MRTDLMNRPLVAEIALWLLLAAGMWAYSYRFDRHIPSFELGPLVWPRVILALIALCAIGLAVSSRRSLWSTNADDRGSGSPDASHVGDARVVALKLSATFAFPLLYVWLLPRAGFFATTPLFLVGYMFIFGQRSPLHLVVTSLCIYGAITVIFSTLLFLPLPIGVWPGFYDFGNAIVSLLGNR